MSKKKFSKREGKLNFWKPKPGDVIEGTLESIRIGKYKEDVYDIKDDLGMITTVPSSIFLRDRIFEEDVGKEIRIKFTGWEDREHGKFRKFDVEVEE